YDSTGKLINTILPEGNQVQNTYDLRGNLLTTTNVVKPGSQLGTQPSTLMTYVEGPTVLNCVNPVTCNKPATETHLLGATTTYTWTSLGQPESVTMPSVTITDENGATTTGAPYTRYCYAPYGSVSMFTGKVDKTTNSANRVARYSYYATTNLVNTVTIDLSSAGNSLDLNCNAITSSGGQNLVTTVTWDTVGNLNTVDGPLSGTSDLSTFYFDAARRITRINGPANSIKRYTYDDDGAVKTTRTSRVTSPSDAVRTSSQPTDLVASQWQTTTNAYDAAGNLISVTDAEGNVITNTYDARDRKVITMDADNRQIAYVFDPASQVLCQWRGGTAWTVGSRPNGAAGCDWIASSYTGSGYFRYVQTQYGGNGQTEWVKDSNNNKTQYLYDGLNRLQFTLYPAPSDGSLCSPGANDSVNPTCNSGLKQTFEKSVYNAAGFKTSFLTRKGDTISSTPDVLGRVLQKSTAGQGGVTYGYNLLGQQTRIAEVAGGGFAAHTTAYTYDGAGRK